MYKQLTLEGLTGSLAALSLGDPAGTPVLALHGWLDNAASFVPLAEHLAGVHLVALDFPGHGHSAHRPSGTGYHFSDYVADVAHATAALGWDRFHLLGHSLGAGVATVYSAVYPQQVTSLVLIDGVGPTTAAADAASDRLRQYVNYGLSAAQKSQLPRLYKDWSSLVFARQQASPISAAGAELLVRRNARETSEGIQLISDRSLRQPSAFYLGEDTVMHFITQVEARCLVILATRGAVISRDITHQRIAAFNDLQQVQCDGNHHVHMDEPALVAAEIRRFSA